MRTITINSKAVDATVLSIDYGTAEVVNYNDWFRNAPNPNFYGQEEHYTTAEIKLLVEANNLAELERKCSQIAGQFRKGLMKDSLTSFSLDGHLTGVDNEIISSKARQLIINFEGVKLGPDTTQQIECVANTQVEFQINGTVTTPAQFYIVPDMSVTTLVMTLNNKAYKFLNIDSGNPITIDSKEGYIRYQGVNGIDHYGSWSFPVLDGGTNRIKFNAPVTLTIRYQGRWM